MSEPKYPDEVPGDPPLSPLDCHKVNISNLAREIPVLMGRLAQSADHGRVNLPDALATLAQAKSLLLQARNLIKAAVIE